MRGTWFHDGQLILLRRRLQDAYAELANAEAASPPAGPVTPGITRARAEAWTAEQALANRIIELQAQDAADRFGG